MSKPTIDSHQPYNNRSSDWMKDALPQFAASLTQCAINSFPRQVLTNVKIRYDNTEKDLKSFSKEIMGDAKNNPKKLASGYSNRFAYQSLSMLPSMMFRENFSKDLSPVQLALACATSEAVIGGFLELRANADSLVGAGANAGLRKSFFSKSFLNTSGAMLGPSIIRNMCGWYVANGKGDNLTEKVIFGIAGGVASSPIDTLVSKVGINASLEENWFKTYAKAVESIVQTAKVSPERILVSAGIRGVASAVAALVISPNFSTLVKNSYQSLFDSVELVGSVPSSDVLSPKCEGPENKPTKGR